jgi:hypothetical protein
MIRASAVAVAASTQVVFMGRCFATIGDPSSELATGLLTLGFGPRFQQVDATHALNRSAGVSYPSVIRGRSLSCLATALNFA